jgi:hypothetical protein
MSDLPVPCANCGRPVRPSQAIWTRQDDDAEPCCCKECYQQHEDEGCPMEHGGYRDNPKLLAAHAAEVERLTGERDNNRLAGIRATKRAYKAMMWWRDKAKRYRQERDTARARDCYIRLRRDAVVEALKKCLAKGSRWHPCDPVVVEARAALAKIEGGQHA